MNIHESAEDYLEAILRLKEAKDLADTTIRNFNKYGQGQASITQMEKERSQVRDQMSEKEKKLSLKKQEKPNHKAPKNLRIGDTVKVMETRPLSKDKRWRLVEVIEKAK